MRGRKSALWPSPFPHALPIDIALGGAFLLLALARAHVESRHERVTGRGIVMRQAKGVLVLHVPGPGTALVGIRRYFLFGTVRGPREKSRELHLGLTGILIRRSPGRIVLRFAAQRVIDSLLLVSW